jgi:hypothetical protein
MNNTNERLTTVVMEDPVNLRFEYLSDTCKKLKVEFLFAKLSLKQAQIQPSVN